jgi:hypothetical protein
MHGKSANCARAAGSGLIEQLVKPRFGKSDTRLDENATLREAGARRGRLRGTGW